MDSNGTPLRLADPRLLGPFQIRARLAERPAGVVFLGEDRSGAPVAIAVLGPAAAGDPSVRERFVAGANDLDSLDAAPHTLPAWVAVRHEPGAPLDTLLDVLDYAALTSEDTGAPTGSPAFAPHWSGGPDPGFVAPPPAFPPPVQAPPRRGGPPTPAIVSLGVIGALAVLVVALVVVQHMIAADPPPRTAPTFTLPPATPSPSAPANDGPPGLVAGPTYGVGERKYPMKLKGVPFEFDAPGTWGCMRSDRAPFDGRWICRDEGGTFPTSGTGAGGMVGVQKCPSPCGEDERKALRKNIVVESGDWRRTDATTMYAEVTGELEGEQVIRVAMSHVFPSKEGGRPDTAVAVQLTGPADQKKTMQKLVNEIRARAS